MNELLRIILIAIVAGIVFAVARGFVQALVDDWRAWRSRHRDIMVNSVELAEDEDFMDELEAAVRRSLARQERK